RPSTARTFRTSCTDFKPQGHISDFLGATDGARRSADSELRIPVCCAYRMAGSEDRLGQEGPLRAPKDRVGYRGPPWVPKTAWGAEERLPQRGPLAATSTTFGA